MQREDAREAARILVRPEEERFQDGNRRWQGCANVEVTRRGRVFVSMITGQSEEGEGTYVVVSSSPRAGVPFRSLEVVVVHDEPKYLVGGGVLWLDPLGRLWLFWTQSYGIHDGRQGVWRSICEDPDAEELHWSAPRRIANGIMCHKPTVLSNGDWLFPCCLWRDGCGMAGYSVRPELRGEQFSNVYLSRDQGETITLHSHADIPDRQFDEHTIVERQDGSLWMLARTFSGIGESFSFDGGRTWMPGRRSALEGPCSLFCVTRLRSGRLLLVNHVNFGTALTEEEVNAQKTGVKKWKGRNNLTALLSEDDGATWPYALLLDAREQVSYPDAAQGSDGTIYVSYDHRRVTRREILMARFTEEDVFRGYAEPEQLAILVNRATGQRDTSGED